MYYTPEPVARFIVRETLAPLLARNASQPDEPVRVLDPACGDGNFLQEAFRYLLDAYRRQRGQDRSDSVDRRIQLLQTHLYGVDLNPDAVEQTRQRLLRLARVDTDSRIMDSNIRCGDALIQRDIFDELAAAGPGRARARGLHPFDWHSEFDAVFRAPNAGFDAVVVNPPYLNVKLLGRIHDAGVREYLRRRYGCARHAYDAYVLFIERAFQLLRQGGRCGMIVPNKLATMAYARPCRQLLGQQTTLSLIADLSAVKVFPGAGVYPYILVWEKSPPGRRHRCELRYVPSIESLSEQGTSARMLQSDLRAGPQWSLHGTLDVESRVATEPLGARVKLHSGTTGFCAERRARQLKEKDQHPGEEHFDFIVSRNIDRYELHLGDVRFMHRRFRQPVLPVEGSELSPAKLQLYRNPKIVIAGISRRIEAAWDDRGVALGVQVFGAQVAADDPRYLLGLLNSRLLSYLFRIRFQSKRLAGGYLAVNKSQLAPLPIRVVPEAASHERELYNEIVRQVDTMHRLHRRRRDDAGSGRGGIRNVHTQIRSTDARIDKLVYGLYGLSDDEIAIVDETMEAVAGRDRESNAKATNLQRC